MLKNVEISHFEATDNDDNDDVGHLLRQLPKIMQISHFVATDNGCDDVLPHLLWPLATFVEISMFCCQNQLRTIGRDEICWYKVSVEIAWKCTIGRDQFCWYKILCRNWVEMHNGPRFQKSGPIAHIQYVIGKLRKIQDKYIYIYIFI